MTEKKMEKLITLRVDEKLLKRIEKYCKKNRLNKSLMTRIAIEKFLKLHNEKDPEPLLLWGKMEMIEIFKHLNEETIEKIAEIAFQTSKEAYEPMKISSDSIKQKTEKQLNDKEIKTLQCKKMFGILKNIIFASKGYNWFNNIHEIWNGPNLKLAGTHDLGFNFSLYIKYRTINHMKPYDYVLVGENLLENKIILDFQQI